MITWNNQDNEINMNKVILICLFNKNYDQM